MKVCIVINGFGRIGRMVFCIVIIEENLDIIVINVFYLVEMLVYLIKYDFIYGVFNGDVKCDDDVLIVNGKRIQLLNLCDLLNLFWKEFGIDLVVEVMGKFNLREKVQLYIEVGVKKVVLMVLGK